MSRSKESVYYAKKGTSIYWGWAVLRRDTDETAETYISQSCSKSEAEIIVRALNAANARGKLSDDV